MDGVLEATGFAHDGQGAVAHGDHLGQAARLEKRWHEEHVGARVHALRERRIELDAGCHGAGVFPLEVAQGVLVVGVAGAQNGHLNTTGQNAVECIRDQIEALLAGQARDHNHERAVVADLKAKLLL